MITIKIALEGDKCIKSILSKGHSNKSNALCAAVSVLEYTFLQNVKHLLNAKIKMSIKDGLFNYQLIHLDIKDKEVYNNLCVFYLIGIEMLVRENNESISLLKAKN